MSNFDQILVRLTKVVGLFLGAGIMVYETGWDHTDRPYLYAAALMMMGLQIAETVEKIASGFGSRGAPPAELSEIRKRPRPKPAPISEEIDNSATEETNQY